jgi:hypothetical protein
MNKYKNSVVDLDPDSIGSADSDRQNHQHNEKYEMVGWRRLLDFKSPSWRPWICHFLTEKISFATVYFFSNV